MILSIEVIKLQKTEIYICTNVRSRLDTSWWLSKYSKFSKIKLNWWNGWIINNSKFCLIDLWHWNSAKVHCIKSNTPTFTTNSIVKLANAWLFYTLVPTIHIDSWLDSPLWEFLSFSSDFSCNKSPLDICTLLQSSIKIEYMIFYTPVLQ